LAKGTCQFSSTRTAVFFTQSASVDVTVGFYMSVHGATSDPSQIAVDSLTAAHLDVPSGSGGTHVFWRSVEGLRVRNDATWSTSQACAMRRMHFDSKLALSYKNQMDWTSGGFMADVTVDGTLDMGTQQQFVVRNGQLNGPVEVGTDSMAVPWNYVFVGTEGAPDPATARPRGRPVVSRVDAAPKIAEKPHLVKDGLQWKLIIPSPRTEQKGTAGRLMAQGIGAEVIPLGSQTFVAKPGMSAAEINAGIVGKRALIVSPAIYELSEPIRITADNFVVLGLGYASLVSQSGRSCLVVAATANNVRLAGIMADAARTSAPTEPLIHWEGGAGAVEGYLSDVFARAGQWGSGGVAAAATRADVMMQIDASGIVADNLWLWLADHSTDDLDGCLLNGNDIVAFPPSAQMVSTSDTSLLVNGDDVIVYGLEAEHNRGNIVQWNGEGGQVYMFQCELPYTASVQGVSMWSAASHAYAVAHNVKEHKAVGLGAYVVNPSWPGIWNAVPVTESLISMPTAADVTMALGWTNSPSRIISNYEHAITFHAEDGTAVAQHGSNGQLCDHYEPGRNKACFVERHLPA